MTRTENYNLPQWEAHDPVRREDFNQAFAALDSAGNVTRDLSGKAAQTSTALQNLSYDLYQIMTQAAYEGKQTGAQKGMWLNTLETAEDAAGRTGAVWNETGTLTVGAGTGMTLDQLNANRKANNALNTASQKNEGGTSVVSFRTCGCATVSRITLYINSLDDDATKAFTTNIRLYNADTETLLYTSDDVTMPSTTGIKSVAVAVDNWQLEAEVNYRLESDLPKNVNLYGGFGFAATVAGAVNAVVTPQYNLTGQIVKTLALETPAARLTGLVRYSGDGEAPRLSVNDQPMTLAATRQTVTADGTACMEAEYGMDGPFEEAVTLQLTMEVGTEEEQSVVYDYGLILL